MSEFGDNAGGGSSRWFCAAALFTDLPFFFGDDDANVWTKDGLWIQLLK